MDDTRKLPVFRSAGEVFSGVTRHYFELARSAPVAVVIYLLAACFILIFNQEVSAMVEQARGKTPEEVLAASTAAWTHRGAWPLLALIAMMGAGMSAAVRWHRFVLLGERTGPLWGRFETRYFWTWLKIMLGMVAFGAVIGIIFSALMFISMVPKEDTAQMGGLIVMLLFAGVLIATYLLFILWLFRVMLALPDAATGGSLGVRAVFAKTRGNGWRLLGYAFVVQFAVAFGYLLIKAVVGLVLKAVLGAAMPAAMGNVEAIAIVVCLPMTLYVAMAGITMLSVAYRELVGLPDVPFPGEGSASAA